MTTSKGPWSYDAESGYVTTKDTTGDWTANQGPRGVTTVCSVESLDGISNGDLIAAAPEMRDALKLFVLYEREMEADHPIGAMVAYAELKAAAYAALAKAER